MMDKNTLLVVKCNDQIAFVAERMEDVVTYLEGLGKVRKLDDWKYYVDRVKYTVFVVPTLPEKE